MFGSTTTTSVIADGTNDELAFRNLEIHERTQRHIGFFTLKLQYL